MLVEATLVVSVVSAVSGVSGVVMGFVWYWIGLKLDWIGLDCSRECTALHCVCIACCGELLVV